MLNLLDAALLNVHQKTAQVQEFAVHRHTGKHSNASPHCVPRPAQGVLVVYIRYHSICFSPCVRRTERAYLEGVVAVRTCCARTSNKSSAALKLLRKHQYGIDVSQRSSSRSDHSR